MKIEQTRIEKELRAVEPLRSLLARRSPDEVELRAVASVLHAVYNGLEAALKKTCSDSGVLPVDRSRWHREFLNAASFPRADGKTLLSGDTAKSLEGLLAFRHFFRNAYGNDLDWELMQPLWQELPLIVDRFFQDIYLTFPQQ